MNEPLPITFIAAVAPNGAIGYRGELPWHLPEDLAHFKTVTMHRAILMGRHTFQSFPHGALPGRLNMVVSRSATACQGAFVFPSITSALSQWKEWRNQQVPIYINKVENDSESNNHLLFDQLFVIGGASIYRQLMPHATRLLLTLVNENPKLADAYFPHFERKEWTCVNTEEHTDFRIVDLRRKPIKI